MEKYETKIALKNGIILDGSKDMNPQEGKTIFIKGDIIEKIAVEEDISPEYKIVDLNGQYIMPGLINMHVHLPASGKPVKKSSDPVKMTKLMTSSRAMRRVLQYVCEASAKMELLSGVTTLRTVGGIENYDALIRDRIINGKSIGSRIIASNVAISVKGGHMAGSCVCIATSAEDAKKMVTKIIHSVIWMHLETLVWLFQEDRFLLK